MSQPDGAPSDAFEAAARTRLGARARICGIDEAGRGPLAGPVVAAAVVLPPGWAPPGLNDSKKLTEKKRAALFEALTARAEIGVGAAGAREIERLNILRANDLAMRRALARLPNGADWALIDGNRTPPELGVGSEALVGGDARCLSIAAASIIAKVLRDRIMLRLDKRRPVYGWASNKGYPSKAHRAAIAAHGPSPHHRRTFGSAKRSSAA